MQVGDGNWLLATYHFSLKIGVMLTLHHSAWSLPVCNDLSRNLNDGGGGGGWGGGRGLLHCIRIGRMLSRLTALPYLRLFSFRMLEKMILESGQR